MPRFGTRTLLVAITVVAIWLSTFANYTFADDARRSILLLIFIASGLAAWWEVGRRRAFWIGFFAAMLLCGGTDWQRPLNRYAPQFPTSVHAPVPPPVLPPAAVPDIDVDFAIPQPVPVSPTAVARANWNWNMAFGASLAAIWILVLSLVSGYIGLYIYDRNH